MKKNNRFLYGPPWLSLCVVIVFFAVHTVSTYQELKTGSTVVYETVHPDTGYFDYKSKGFNTVEDHYSGGYTEYCYYLLNNPLYSNAYIRAPTEEGTNYPGIRYEITQKTDGKHESLEVSLLGDYRSISWGFHFTGGGHLTRRRIYTETSMTETYHYQNRISDMVLELTGGRHYTKYYNIPEFEVEQKYVTEFTQSMITIVSHGSLFRMREDPVTGFQTYLPYFTNYELAIIRNCLFAKHGYDFQTEPWKKFIETYYSPHYKGMYTNAEVLERFSEDETWLLNLIVEYERR
jgi:hypothetical protein